MSDFIEIICPECWFSFMHPETEDLILCPECGYEFYKDESLTD